MAPALRNNVRRKVLAYMRDQAQPVTVSCMARDLRSLNKGLADLRDADVRAVVQPMIVTGKLSYAPGLKIKLGKAIE